MRQDTHPLHQCTSLIIMIYSFMLSSGFILGRVTEDLESIPVTVGMRQGYTLDRTPVMHTQLNLGAIININAHFKTRNKEVLDGL